MKPGIGWRRLNFDLHSAIGFWTLGIVLWWSISGVFFAWPNQVSALVNAVFKLQGMRPPHFPADDGQVKAQVTLDAMVEKARRATPHGTMSGIAFPASPGEAFVLYVDRGRPGDFSHRDIHWLSASSGAVLGTWHYGDNQTIGDWIVWAMYPIHFGTLRGIGPKIAWCICGLALPGLSVTGFVMYWNRKLRFCARRLSQMKQ